MEIQCPVCQRGHWSAVAAARCCRPSDAVLLEQLAEHDVSVNTQPPKKVNANAKEAVVQIEVQGSGAKPYIVSIYDDGTPPYCTCPAWKFQSKTHAEKSCKHTSKVMAELDDDGFDDDVADEEMLDLESTFATGAAVADSGVDDAVAGLKAMKAAAERSGIKVDRLTAMERESERIRETPTFQKMLSNLKDV